jgi:CubicO group peptidase (beta-lactamase class C family)
VSGPARSAGELIDAAVDRSVIPGAVLAAGRGREPPAVLHVAGYAQHDEQAVRAMTADTIFDLASLTKVLATLPCALRLVAAGEVGLDDPVRRYLTSFAGAEKDQVTVRQLLTHTSGLPAHRPYFELQTDPAAILAAVLAEPLVAAPGTVCCYSDLGFIVLGELCAEVARRPLDELAQELVFRPLGMTSTGYRPDTALADRIASTEPDGGEPKTGVVHDENAAALGGVAGHAGLFGTASDLGRYAAAWATTADPDPGSGSGPGAGTRGLATIGVSCSLSREAVRCQTDELARHQPLDRRGLGWGLRGDRWDNMGDGWPATGAGHTGFTGTSISIDPGTGLWAVLLTNAVHFGRGPEHSVTTLRKQVHGLIAAAPLGRTGQ